MKLEQLLDRCRAWTHACKATGNADTTACEIAQAVLDLLAESAPCGWEQPGVGNNRSVPPDFHVDVPSNWGGVRVDPDDARAMARMLLVAADEAEASAEAEGESE